MKQLAHIVTQQLVMNHIINEEEAELYDYGLQLLLTAGGTSLGIIVLGLVTQQLPLTILFMLALMGLRHYAGGYHAQTYLHCFLLSCSAYLGLLIFVHVATLFFDMRWGILTSLAICVYICYHGSINSEKNEKTQQQMQQRVKVTRIIACFFTTCMIIIYCKGFVWQEAAWLLVYVQALTALGMLAVLKKKKKTK